jgi:hypothetical protein
MYKPSTHLVVVTYFPTDLVTKVKPNINSVEVHPQLSKWRASSGWCAGGCGCFTGPCEPLVPPTYVCLLASYRHFDHGLVVLGHSYSRSPVSSIPGFYVGQLLTQLGIGGQLFQSLAAPQELPYPQTTLFWFLCLFERSLPGENPRANARGRSSYF